MDKKMKQLIAIICICIIIYNVAVFVIGGFEHGGSFWVSYVFMMIAIVVAISGGIILAKRNREVKDWLFGFPVLRHCFFYVGIEFVLSVLFMLLDAVDCDWRVAFIIQLVVCGIYCVFIISCFMVKETIENVENKVKESVSFVKELRIEVEMIAVKAKDDDVKQKYTELAEKIRYCDPVSNPSLNDVEERLYAMVKMADGYVTVGDNENSMKCYYNLEALMEERNKRCMTYK